MNIFYNGHASFTVSSDGFSITVDPWVNSAFLGSWHPFPDNSFRLPDLLKSDAILLSHEHEDHCDIELLKQFKGALFIPKYRSDSFCQKLSAQHISYTEIPPREKYAVGPFMIEFVIQSAPAWDDAAIIISKEDMTFVNLNDLKPSVSDIEHIKEVYPSPTFLAYQYSGASWHPMTYKELDQEAKTVISHRKIAHKFKNTLRLIREFEPKFIIPSAGPPCFLYDEHIPFNNGDTAVFPGLNEYYAFLQRKHVETISLFMKPGDPITIQEKEVLFDDQLRSPENLANRQEHIRTLKTRRNIGAYFKDAASHDIAPLADIMAYFNRAFSNSMPFKNLLRYLVQYEIVGKDKTESIYVNYRKNIVTINGYNKDDKDAVIGYKFTIPAGPFNKIISGEHSWEELFLSLQFDMYQYLPHHDENFFTLHKFCHTDYLQRYFVHYKNSFRHETFNREHNGKLYTIQKYCPHAMGDLSKGEIIDDKIVCPSHGWAFCLKDGTSVEHSATIRIKEIGNTAESASS